MYAQQPYAKRGACTKEHLQMSEGGIMCTNPTQSTSLFHPNYDDVIKCTIIC